MSNIKNLSFLFENSDPFAKYSREREEEALARQTFYILQEMINDRNFILQEGAVWDAVKNTGKKIVAAGKGAVKGAAEGYKKEKIDQVLQKVGNQFFAVDEKGQFVRNPDGKILWKSGDEGSFLKAMKEAFPNNDKVESISKDWLAKNVVDKSSKDSTKIEGNDSVDTSEDGNEKQIKSGLSSMKKINVQDFVDAFKEAKNDGLVTAVLNDSDFAVGIQRSLSTYLDLKIQGSSNDPAAQTTYKKIQELFGKNKKLARPIGYAAAAMINHMIGEIVNTKDGKTTVNTGKIDKMQKRTDATLKREGQEAIASRSSD